MVSTCDHTWSMFSVPSTIYWNRAGSYCIHTKKFFSVQSRVSQFHSETRQPLAFWPGISLWWARLEDWLLKKGFLFLTDFCFRKHLQSGSAVCLVLCTWACPKKRVRSQPQAFPKAFQRKRILCTRIGGQQKQDSQTWGGSIPNFS